MFQINCSYVRGRELELVEKGCLSIENGKIKEISKEYSSQAKDFKDFLVLPAFINAHTHLGDSFAKEGVYGLCAEDAVGPRGEKWRLYNQTTEREILEGMKDSMQYMLQCGITTFADFRENSEEGRDRLKEARRDIPIDTIILGRNFPQRKVKEEKLNLGLNPYPESLKQIRNSEEIGFLGVHAGEEEGELQKVIPYNPDFIVHATLAKKRELEKIAQKRIAVIICPRSNLALKVGFPPIEEMLNLGIPLALGTDNVMINSPNVFREMEFISKIYCLEAKEILKMVTVNPAQLFELECGIIEKEKNADLIFIDKNALNLRKNKNWLATIVNRCEPENVRRIMKNGKLIVNKDDKVGKIK